MEKSRTEAPEPTQSDQSEKIQASLKGNTLRTYVFLVKSHPKSVGVRELQRALGFSSPNLSLYHLNKLVEMGLASNADGEYHLVKEVKVDVLRQFVKLGGLLLPRFVLYATMFTIMLAYFALQVSALNVYSVWALIFGVAAAVISWVEAVRAWKVLP